MADSTCVACGMEKPAYDSDRSKCSRCKYAERERVACSECGGPTGWTAGRRETATCNACRRSVWQHGTRKGYRDNKCRCPKCREWGTEVVRKARKAYRAKGMRPPGGSGPWINPNVRAAVFERDGFVCQICHEPTEPTASPQHNRYPSLDHIKPQSLGGSHGIENLRTAHRWCNSIRGAKIESLDDDLVSR